MHISKDKLFQFKTITLTYFKLIKYAKVTLIQYLTTDTRVVKFLLKIVKCVTIGHQTFALSLSLGHENRQKPNRFKKVFWSRIDLNQFLVVHSNVFSSLV